MSYDIYIYDKSAKEIDISSEKFGGCDMPKIPPEKIEAFKNRLLKYEYTLSHEDEKHAEYEHKNRNWGIQVNIFKTEIAFTVPYWDDADNAIFEALLTASELCDNGDLLVYDPQNGDWVDA